MLRARHPYVISTLSVFLVLLVTLLVVDRPVKSEREIERRIAEGKKVGLRHHVPVWLWRGLCVNVGLAGLLVALSPLATKPLRGLRRAVEAPPLSKPEWLLLGLAAGLFLCHGVPRLSHSLWGDEENLMLHCIADQVTKQADGSLVIEPVSWRETFWNYTRPTNHIGYTVVARLFHELVCERGTGPTDPFFSETAMRLPVLLSGLGWLVALVWCCRVWGWHRGAVPAALALSGHAWLTRFGVDARGYGFVVLLLLVMLACLGRALQTGRWRWWIGFGLAQFYLVWVHPGSVHGPVMMNVAALVMIIRDRETSDRMVLGVRWLVATVVCSMLLIGLMAPILTPFLGFLKKHVLAGEIDGSWLIDAWAYLATGTPWFPWASDNPLCVSLRDSLFLPGWLSASVLGGLGVLMGWGIWVTLRQAGQRWLLLFLLGGPALMLLHLVVSGTRPYHWYAIPFLPCVVVLWAVAIHEVGRWRWWVTAGLVLAVAGLAWQQNDRLLQHPMEAIRESVAMTRGVTNPRNDGYGKDVMTACCMMTPGGYDHGALEFDSVEGLRKVMAEADRRKLPLFVNFGFRALYREVHPEVLALLDDRQLFEPVGVWPGLFFPTTREVVRYRGSVPEP